ncbi:flagellar hook-associated protein FlgL [Tuberibacillus sp. Marseille-P3662]|uniref:flagellar hook-associated protein FlgL n=1 Tax=Tuberibacillus sp. Marseille-P3662 TaxID=1965358 RepID=UPI000A1C90A5|nr:flagellar hook-associated protein FlgL [Tuberibacillus sp. Marseille-P3662]
MRVTQGMMSQDILRQIRNSNQQMSRYQQQLATGKKITRPSQDPVVATMGIGYRTNVAHVEQYERNMNEVQKWTDSTGSALDQVNSVLQRVRELTVQASNDTYDESQREHIAGEVEQLRDELVNISETKVAGKYIFNGESTQEPPLSKNEDGDYQINLAEDHKQVKIAVNDGVKIQVNTPPGDVFDPAMFKDLNNLIGKLKGDSNTEDSASFDDFIGTIDSHIDRVLGTQAELGAKQNRVDMVKQRLGKQKEMATEIMSNNEDANFEKTLIELKQQESVHRAALSVGSRMIQPTLVDFLK